MAHKLRSDLATLFRFMSPARRRQLVWLCVLMPLTAVAEMAMVGALVPFLAQLAAPTSQTYDVRWLELLGQWASAIAGGPVSGAALAFISAAIAAAILRLGLSWLSQRFAFGLGHELAVEVQRRLLHQPYLFHVSRHSSELLSSLDKVDHLVTHLVLQLIQAASALLIGALVGAVLIDLDAESAALAALLIVALYGLALVAVRGRLERNADIVGSSYEKRIQAVHESLGAIRDIILDRSQGTHVDQFSAIDSRFMRARAEIAFLSSAPRILVEMLGLILIAALAVTVAGRDGGLLSSLPILGALALGAQRLLPLASQLFSGWTSLTTARPIVADLARLIGLPVPEQGEQQSPLTLRQAISFHDVSFRYPDRVDYALYNISLAIPRGARVAIVGRTGSGKSTLADLLMGLIEPDSGRISMDSVELSHDRLSAWQASIAHVPQAIFLVDDTIAHNIALARPGSDLDLQRVRQAATIAQLSEFIDSLSGGYATKVGERGVRLSGGQRQRLALARAIYKDAQLLVLDEATSALDDTTEAAVLAALDELTAEGRTIVIIAHRLSTVEKCDLIYQLEEGTLVRSGSFEDVFGKAGSLTAGEL